MGSYQPGPSRIVVPTVLHVGANTLSAALIDDSRDPVSARLDVYDDGDVTTWLFARELLRSGLDGPAGDGDVRIQPATHATLAMTFSDGELSVTVLVSRGDVEAFLHAGDTTLPQQRRDAAVSAELERFLDEL